MQAHFLSEQQRIGQSWAYPADGRKTPAMSCGGAVASVIEKLLKSPLTTFGQGLENSLFSRLEGQFVPHTVMLQVFRPRMARLTGAWTATARGFTR